MTVLGEIPPKFAGLKTDPETKVFLRAAAELDGYGVVYEKWCWEHINAESIIFIESEVAHLSDEQLEALVRSSPIVAPGIKMTISRTGCGYCSVNFNFTIDD